MLVPLFLMALGFTFYYMMLLMLRVRSEIVARKIRTVQLLQAAP